jgi:hypothetical protein
MIRLFMTRLLSTRGPEIGVALMLTVAICGAAAQSAQPAAQTKPTGLIVGRVIDGSTNTPLAGATVTLSGTGLRALRVIVDPQGRFVFTSAPAGSFTITATRTGYLTGSYGALRPDGAGRPLDLRDGERVGDVVVRAWRYATISGAVTDDAGDAVPFMRVQVLKRTIVAGRWRLVNSNQGADADDRGVYRITGLTPGDYALVISTLASSLPVSLMEVADAVRRMPPAEASGLQRELQTNGTGGYLNDLMQRFPTTRVGDLLLQTTGKTIVGADDQSIESYPTVWYPNVATPAEASIVSVRAGEELSGIDLHPTLTKTLRVSGTALGPNGPMAFLALRLVPARLDMAAAEITSSLSNSLTTSMTATDAEGAFTFVGVTPGQYVIRALTSPRPPAEPPMPAGTTAPAPLVPVDPTFWAETAVTVAAADVAGVAVSMRPGLRVTGRVEFNGTAPKPSGAELRSIAIVMDPADGRTTALSSAYRAQIDPGGRFYSIGLPPGRYLLRIDRPPRGWTLKSAVVNGGDICDVPLTLANGDIGGLVLTFTDQPTTIAGLVRDAQGRADDDATVLIFPADGNWADRGPSPRRVRAVRASHTGAFSTSGVPAGEYFVVAVSDAQASNWQDQEFLARLGRVANRLALNSGQAVNLSLTTAEGIVR